MAVFLGNPGTEYRNTRHNAGWMLLDALPGSQTIVWQRKFKGSCGDYPVTSSAGGRKILLLKPETYMNLSGSSVQPAAAFYKIAPREIIVVHDEIELPYGTLSVRQGGGLGGHNGLRSIAGALGTNEFARLRIGVGRPSRGDVAAYVLGRFSPEEEPLLGRILTGASQLLLEASGDDDRILTKGRTDVLFDTGC